MAESVSTMNDRSPFDAEQMVKVGARFFILSKSDRNDLNVGNWIDIWNDKTEF